MSKAHKYSEELLKEAVKNSYSISEVIKKLNGNSRSGALFSWIKNKIKLFSIDTSHFCKKNTTFSSKKRKAEDILVYSNSDRRERAKYLRRSLLEIGMEYKCVMCNNDGYWLGDSITLEIDHIDCNHKNNLINNLRFLCPNCHSQRHRPKPKIFSNISCVVEQFGSLLDS